MATSSIRYGKGVTKEVGMVITNKSINSFFPSFDFLDVFNNW